MHVELVTIVVDDYDPAIRFFVDAWGFDLVADSPASTNDGRPKRWVVVHLPGAAAGILLARADGEDQAVAVCNQVAGRVRVLPLCRSLRHRPSTNDIGWRRVRH